MDGSPSDDEARELVAAYPKWYHRIEVRSGIVTPGVNDSPRQLRLLDLPTDCAGLRVLDIGARDGFFSFEMERRGADVLAVDYAPVERTGFPIAARLLGSRVEFRQENIYNLRADDLGTFDIVLFLGLLYHLPDPLRALRIVRSLCRSRMYLESLVIDRTVLLPDGSDVPLKSLDERLVSVPLMQFFPGAARKNDPTNYWGPNIECVRAMLAETEFSVVRVSQYARRAVFECRAISDPPAAYYLGIAEGTQRL